MMTFFLYGGLALVSLIALLLVVLRLRSERSRLIAVAIYALGLVAAVAVAGASRERSDAAREIDRAVADLGQRYVLFRSLGPPDSTLFDENECRRGAERHDHRFLQRTWRIAQPVDFPTLEAALERDGFETSPVSDSGATAYGFLANRDDLAIQVQSLDPGTEVRVFSGPCVPRPTIELAKDGLPLATAGLYLP